MTLVRLLHFAGRAAVFCRPPEQDRMRKVSLSLVLLALAVAGSECPRAMAAARTPSMAVSDPSNPVQIPRQRVNVEQLKPSASFFTQIKQRFSRFRPAWDQDALPMTGNEEILQGKNFLDQVYDSEMSQRMSDKYRDTVSRWERVAEDPTWQATRTQRQRYMDSQRDMAKWAMKEIGKDQLRDYLEARRRSGGGGLFSVVKDMGGGNSSLKRQEAEIARQKAEDKKLSEEERIARVHRRDAVSEEDEEEIPTKLRTKLNFLKARGQLSLQNSIVNATVEGGGSGDKLSLELFREFRKLELQSKARYNVDKSYIAVNVSKRITKEVAVDVSSERWTGAKRGDSGEKAKDSAKVTYSLAF
jgi:hypothetical protein